MFWLITMAMVLISYLCILPWLIKSPINKLVIALIAIFTPLFSYLSYHYLGYSSKLDEYYSENALAEREKQLEIRPLLAELNKDEVRLVLHLEEFPDDVMTKCKLMDILAIRALQSGDKSLADRYWQEALKLLPKTSEAEYLRHRMLNLRERLRK